ncbi:MAG: DUF4397 domain-containing protein [Ignavibacteriae bacterium]|nr:DUF4397 domain-containing protein [Ignavibacteriota bacterium]
MKRISFFSVCVPFIVGLLIVAGCKSDDSKPNDPGGGGTTGTSKVMVVHASPGSPAIDLYVDTTRARANLAYASNTGYISISAGIHSLKATIAGTQTILISVPLFPVPENVIVTAFAADTGIAVTATAFSDTLTVPASGKASVRYINMMARSTGVGAYVDAGATATATLDFLVGTSFLSIDAGQHTVEFKSGTTTLATLTNYAFQAGKIYTVWLKGLNGTTGATAPGVEVILNN